MPLKRVWDESCPLVYDQWEDGGISWVIQDLAPEDDDEAVQLLLTQLAPDEALCIASGITEDDLSMRSMGKFWKKSLGMRSSLACYAHQKNSKTLAAVNCCLFAGAGDQEEICKIEGECWQNVYNALHYAETRANAFEILGEDKVLYGMGLVVRREFRGAKLGVRMLAAREPLCRSQGVKGTSTVFTGPASQRSAERAGFTTAAEVTFTQLSEAGMKYPHENKSIKLMLKKFAT